MTEEGHGGSAGAIETPGGSAGPTGAGEGPAPAREARALWPAVLQALADRAAHEIRGALNGVAVNLEVVRMRTERPGGSAEVGPFLGNALEQLDVLTERTEALLAVTRPAVRPFDVRLGLRRLVTLLGPVARAAGGTIEIADEDDGVSAATAADPETARLVLAAAMLAWSDGDRRLLCRIDVRDAIIVRVEGADGALPLAAELVRLAADAGIGIESAPAATIVAFPAGSR